MRRLARLFRQLFRRPFRHPLTLCSAASLLLCVAACALWVRSVRLTDHLIWRSDGGWRSVRSAEGYVVVVLLLDDWSGLPAEFYGLQYECHAPGRPLHRLGPGGPGDRDYSWTGGGFAWHARRNAGRGTLTARGVVPFWSVALATAALPLWWTTTRLRSHVLGLRRSRLGLCPTCGYDLRAHRAGERCPECGTPAPPTTTVNA